MPPAKPPAAASDRRTEIIAALAAGRIDATEATRRLKQLAAAQERANQAARHSASRTRWAWLAVIRIADEHRGRRLFVPLPMPLLWPVIPIAQWGMRFAARHAGDSGGVDLSRIPVGQLLASFLRTGGTGKVIEVSEGGKTVQVWVW